MSEVNNQRWEACASALNGEAANANKDCISNEKRPVTWSRSGLLARCCAMWNFISFLPQLEIFGKYFPFFFFSKMQKWTNTFHRHGNDIHPGWTAAPGYVTGFWSILGCLQKEFTCRNVQWKSSLWIFPFGVQQNEIPWNTMTATLPPPHAGPPSYGISWL